MAQDPAPLRFSLRFLFLIGAIVALACTFLPSWLNYRHDTTKFRVAATLTALAGAFAGFVLGRNLASFAYPLLRIRLVRYLALLLRVMLAFSTCYLMWAHHRWVSFDDSLYPRPWPYPDKLLNHYHDWVDARNPVDPNQIKFHGEFDTVTEHIRCSTFASIVAAFFAVGLIAPNATAGVESRAKSLIRRVRRG
jgi:hypothetical protein